MDKKSIPARGCSTLNYVRFLQIYYDLPHNHTGYDGLEAGACDEAEE